MSWRGQDPSQQRVFRVSRALDRLSLLCEQHHRQIDHHDGAPDWNLPQVPAGKRSYVPERTPLFFAWGGDEEETKASSPPPLMSVEGHVFKSPRRQSHPYRHSHIRHTPPVDTNDRQRELRDESRNNYETTRSPVHRREEVDERQGDFQSLRSPAYRREEVDDRRASYETTRSPGYRREEEMDPQEAYEHISEGTQTDQVRRDEPPSPLLPERLIAPSPARSRAPTSTPVKRPTQLNPTYTSEYKRQFQWPSRDAYVLNGHTPHAKVSYHNGSRSFGQVIGHVLPEPDTTEIEPERETEFESVLHRRKAEDDVGDEPRAKKRRVYTPDNSSTETNDRTKRTLRYEKSRNPIFANERYPPVPRRLKDATSAYDRQFQHWIGRR